MKRNNETDFLINIKEVHVGNLFNVTVSLAQDMLSDRIFHAAYEHIKWHRNLNLLVKILFNVIEIGSLNLTMHQHVLIIFIESSS